MTLYEFSNLRTGRLIYYRWHFIEKLLVKCGSDVLVLTGFHPGEVVSWKKITPELTIKMSDVTDDFIPDPNSLEQWARELEKQLGAYNAKKKEFTISLPGQQGVVEQAPEQTASAEPICYCKRADFTHNQGCLWLAWNEKRKPRME